jgi:hypothetical protein
MERNFRSEEMRRKNCLTDNDWIRGIIDKHISLEDEDSSPNELLDLVILLMNVLDSFQIEITKLPLTRLRNDDTQYVDVKQTGRSGTYEIEEGSALEEIE